MPVTKVLSDSRFPVKIWTDDVEDEALGQLKKLAGLPFIHKHVAVMPDVHAGIGSTIGSVIATTGAIVPAAVGVDVGCGAAAYKLELRAEHLPDDLSSVRSAIEKKIPHGRTDNGGERDRGAWHDVPDDIAELWKWLSIDERYRKVVEKQPKLLGKHTNTARHLSTLGTGNHFVELCVDESGDCWLMVHSGSRGIGNRIGTFFIELAKKEMEKWFVHLPDANLAYLPEGSELFDQYWDAVSWAQDYAEANRTLMQKRAVRAIADALGRDVTTTGVAVNRHHNYVDREHHFGKNVFVTRKGAVRARKDDLGVIPGSMGTKSFIVRGKGNAESFCSCSHGAGRRMSRTAARNTFTTKDLVAQTMGVECRKDKDVIDEIPGAYKDVDDVIARQSDLIDVVAVLKQVVCVKG